MAPLVLWMACLVVGILSFHTLGTGRLAPPPMAPSQWSVWAAGRDPLLATVAVLRLGVLALAWYLVGATSIGLVARLLRAARFVRVADALTVPMVRRLLQGTVGLTMATAVVAASMPTPDAVVTADRGTLTLSAVVEPDAPDGSATLAVKQDSTGDPGALRPHPDGGELTLRGAGRTGGVGTAAPSASGSLTLRPSPSDPVGAGAATDDEGPDDGASNDEEGVVEGADVDRLSGAVGGHRVLEHEVRAGESFWSIAEAMVLKSLDRRPTEDEVRDYWRILVAANQERLAVGDDADLIFPGQRFVVPSVEATVDQDGAGS